MGFNSTFKGLLKLIVAASVAEMSAARICAGGQLCLRVCVWPAAFYSDACVTGFFLIFSTAAAQVQVKLSMNIVLSYFRTGSVASRSGPFTLKKRGPGTSGVGG